MSYFVVPLMELRRPNGGPQAPSGGNWSKEADGKKIGVSITGGR